MRTGSSRGISHPAVGARWGRWSGGVGLVTGAFALACGWGDVRASDAAITRELLVPYADALSRGQYEGAWETYTTPGYRRSTGLIAYQAGQSRNRDEFGAQVRITLLPDEPVPVEEPGRPPMLRVSARYEGEEGSAVIMLDLVDGPPWRIERTWVWPDDRLGTERVF